MDASALTGFGDIEAAELNLGGLASGTRMFA
jgi:hypothetical protein